MRIYVLYDDRRPDAMQNVGRELARQGIINYQIFPSIKNTNPTKSINLSQKEIVKKAKEDGFSEVAILEDDIMFPSTNAWNYFIQNKPKEFDIYLGGTYLMDDKIEYRPYVVKVKEYFGHHCIIVSSNYYDKFLATPDHLDIDTAQANKGNFYVCYPFPALQRPGLSLVTNERVDYNTLINPRHIYDAV